MIDKIIVNRVKALKIMPVIKIENPKDAVPLAKVLVENGLPAAEITFRTTAAAESIREIRKAYPDIILCAGTVLTTDQVDMAVDAGADFVVSPGFNPTTVKHCLRKGVGIIPGINNPSQIEQALELGVEVLKFFPAEASGGINMLKSLVGPYGDISLMPTGGVNLNNLTEYLDIPQVMACGGTWIAPTRSISAHDWKSIGEQVIKTRSVLEEVRR